LAVVVIRARPTSWSLAIKYEYTRQVISGLECPSHYETAATETPARSGSTWKSMAGHVFDARGTDQGSRRARPAEFDDHLLLAREDHDAECEVCASTQASGR
jgi:hypothetical protein